LGYDIVWNLVFGDLVGNYVPGYDYIGAAYGGIMIRDGKGGDAL